MSNAPPGRRTSSRGSGRVTALPVASYLPGREIDRPAPEAVGESGLAGARGPEEHDRRTGLEKATDGVHAHTAERADGHDVTGTDQPLGRLDGACDIFGDVRFGQHRDRGGTTLPGQHEETLQTPGPEAALERADDEHLVDVRGEHLRSLGTSGAAAHDGAAPREHLFDQTALKHDPITDRRCFQRIGVVSELGGYECPQLAGFGENHESAAIDPSDPARHGTVDETVVERSLERRPPSELGKRRPRLIGCPGGSGGPLRWARRQSRCCRE